MQQFVFQCWKTSVRDDKNRPTHRLPSTLKSVSNHAEPVSCPIKMHTFKTLRKKNTQHLIGFFFFLRKINFDLFICRWKSCARTKAQTRQGGSAAVAAAFYKRTFVFNYRVFTLPQPHVNLAPPSRPPPQKKKKYLTHTVALALLTKVNRAMI